MVQNFKKLAVYNEAYQLSKEVYDTIHNIKAHFRLKEQLFGSTTSVPANIAEMAAMLNKNQQAQKVRICIGECNETEFWLDFCKDCSLIQQEKYNNYCNRVNKIRRMLFGLIQSIKADNMQSEF